MDVPYYDELVEYRRFFTAYFKDMPEKKPFPKHKCKYASKFISAQLGLEGIAGHHGYSWHAWNYDRDLKLYVDITLDQFDDKFDSISILEPNNKILRKCKTQTKNLQRNKGVYGLANLSEVLAAYALWKSNPNIRFDHKTYL